jgi:hypothetical protein
MTSTLIQLRYYKNSRSNTHATALAMAGDKLFCMVVQKGTKDGTTNPGVH